MSIRIAHFAPYYVPHRGGLETHAEQFAMNREQSYPWTSIVLVGSSWQEVYLNWLSEEDKIYYQWTLVWYLKFQVPHYIIPDRELVPNFPLPLFRTKEYRLIMKCLKEFGPDIVISRTRFFLMSSLVGLRAKLHHVKRVHIEHGSSYVQLSSKIKNSIAWIYDQTLGRFAFKYADSVVPISRACQRFVQNFTKRETTVIRRGVQFPDDMQPHMLEDLSTRFPWKTIIGFVWRLYKRKNVEALIDARYLYCDQNPVHSTQLVIVGDGEDYARLREHDVRDTVYFTWGVSFEESLAYQSQFDIHVHSSLPWWGLASTLLQAMWLWCTIVATPNEWADEVITDGKNGILLSSDSSNALFSGMSKALKTSKETQEHWATYNKDTITHEFSRMKVIWSYAKVFNELVDLDSDI